MHLMRKTCKEEEEKKERFNTEGYGKGKRLCTREGRRGGRVKGGDLLQALARWGWGWGVLPPRVNSVIYPL